MEFNKNNFNNFRSDVELALKEVAKKYEVEIQASRITYGNFDFTMQLKATKNNENINVEQEKFNRLCGAYGFITNDYKLKIEMQGRKFELIGFNTRSPKNSCSIREISTGRVFKTSDESVKRNIVL